MHDRILFILAKMASEFKNHDDLVADVATILMDRCLAEGIPDREPIRAFYNFAQVFERYSQICSKNPIFGQMIDVAWTMMMKCYYMSAITSSDAHLVLKYAVENKNANVGSYMQHVILMPPKCTKYLYKNEKTRKFIVDHLIGRYTHTYTTLFSNRNFVATGAFIIKHNIVDRIRMLSNLFDAGADTHLLGSLIRKYNIQYSADLIKRICMLYGLIDENRFISTIDMYMSCFDKSTVFKDLVNYALDLEMVEMIFEKYNIASILTEKLNVIKVGDFNVAVYLIMQGMCEYDEEEFWNRFVIRGDFECAHNFTDEELQFFYDKSNCCICLQTHMFTRDSRDSAIKRVLAYFSKLKMKICENCAS
jgi:hypothetical protein